MPLYVVNSEPHPDRDGRWPVNRPAGGWVGNLYQKTGNVFKYLMLTGADISGQAGVFGPIDPADLQAAIDADGGSTRGWIVDDVPNWAVGGYGLGVGAADIRVSGDATGSVPA